MTYYKITLSLDGRDVELSVREGVMATAEFGSLVDGERKPEMRVATIVSAKDGDAVAWTQVARYVDGIFQVESERWIGHSTDSVILGTTELSGGLILLDDLPESHSKCLRDTEFGTLSCCTANGSGCYVTCCGSCCADPTRCPGASCCP